MGLKDMARRLRSSVEELHDERLQDRFAGMHITPIRDLECRTKARVGGEVARMRLTPRSGVPALEIVVSDGTGDVVAIFTGRRTLPGLTHGGAIILEGVAHLHHGRRVILNPAYTLL